MKNKPKTKEPVLTFEAAQILDQAAKEILARLELLRREVGFFMPRGTVASKTINSKIMDNFKKERVAIGAAVKSMWSLYQSQFEKEDIHAS